MLVGRGLEDSAVLALRLGQIAGEMQREAMTKRGLRIEGLGGQGDWLSGCHPPTMRRRWFAPD